MVIEVATPGSQAGRSAQWDSRTMDTQSACDRLPPGLAFTRQQQSRLRRPERRQLGERPRREYLLWRPVEELRDDQHVHLRHRPPPVAISRPRRSKWGAAVWRRQAGECLIADIPRVPSRQAFVTGLDQSGEIASALDIYLGGWRLRPHRFFLARDTESRNTRDCIHKWPNGLAIKDVPSIGRATVLLKSARARLT